MGTSVDHVVVSSGVTAEKLMYDRALEMSRSAAINELTGEDLPGCEISYVTAIRMLEAILEGDDDMAFRKAAGTSTEKDPKPGKDDESPINGMEAEDRKTVRNCKPFFPASFRPQKNFKLTVRQWSTASEPGSQRSKRSCKSSKNGLQLQPSVLRPRL
jgi:hypothetical protein